MGGVKSKLPRKKRLPMYARKSHGRIIDYRVDIGILGGKRKFKSFPTRSQAEIYAEEEFICGRKSRPGFLG